MTKRSLLSRLPPPNSKCARVIASLLLIGSVRSLYTWSAWKPDNADSLGYEFWPMLHDASAVSDFESNVVAGYGTNILGFNECVFNSPMIFSILTLKLKARNFWPGKHGRCHGRLLVEAVHSA